MTTDELSKLTQRMVDAVGELTGPGGTVALVAYASEADLLRFHPDWAGTLQEHRQVLNAVALTVTDRTIQLVQMNRRYYESWLDGREDSTAMRSAWAATIVARG